MAHSKSVTLSGRSANFVGFMFSKNLARVGSPDAMMADRFGMFVGAV